ncbi:AAA family ATPase [Putridiphycobacter roseus]|uniref:AAA family ATPase n=1 Tax=Putridiphycobacter roseus TaxID=2219161 RepID=A0A2W1NSL6_9FLAO|nr:AAA family ATPase [Putridiphycobacter roseus]PZE18642.1 AAA family ATPase [Putridiphycobacter roseus]
MEKLFKAFNIKLNTVNDTLLERYLVHDIDFNERLIAIKGSRGVGKTTLLLQYIKSTLKNDGSVLYVSLDDFYFQANSLVGLAEEFYENGGKYLFLDEVHKYDNWSIELKTIYDTYNTLNIVFTSSSILEIYKGAADLSRRAVSYELRGLSFREFLKIDSDIELESYDLETICKNHISIASEITKDLRIIPHFKRYLKLGYYPFYKQGELAYHQKLANTVTLALEVDVPSIYNTEYQTIHKLKRLLYVIAMSVPFQPNITKLSAKIDTTSRSSTLLYLDYLERANLITNLKTSGKGNNYLVKPDKIYLENTNLMYAIGSSAEEVGNLRETFFLNQLNYKHQVNNSVESDFLVNEKYTFEVGGKHKSSDQIKGLEQGFIAADNIEVGFRNKVPLWLFGFLY